MTTKYTPGPKYIKETTKADARLIAAAPDMVEALQQALKIVDAHRRIALGEGDLTAYNIRQALSKALGEDFE